MGVLDTIESASPTRKAVRMCLDGALQAEWDQLLDSLDDVARRDVAGESLALPATMGQLTAMDDLRDRMAGSEVSFLFERVPWQKRIGLQALHAPREDVAMDLVRGFNIETYYPALVRASCLSATDVEGDTAKVPAKLWDRLLGRPGATHAEPPAYASLTVASLLAEIAKRDTGRAPEDRIEVEPPGNKANLVAALEADDAPSPGSLNFKQVNRLIDAALYVNEGETSVPPSARSLLASQDFGASLAQPSPGTPPPNGSEGGSPRTSPTSSTTKKAPSKGRSSGT